MASDESHAHGCVCAACAANSSLEESYRDGGPCGDAHDGDAHDGQLHGGANRDEALSSFVWPTGGTGAGLISGSRWNGTEITYAFPDAAESFDTNLIAAGVQYGAGEPLNGFAALSGAQAAAVEAALAQYAAVSGLTFTRIASADAADATLRMAQSATPSTAWGYYPSFYEEGGDVWFGTGSDWYANPTRGDYGWHTVLHELGHALGLKHGHETDAAGALPSAEDSMEYSVMTYRAYVGDPLIGGYSNEAGGYAQTLMQADIAAIQEIYGANYDHNAGDTTYRWSAETGETFIDGEGQGAPVENRIFVTVWDGGGEDTFDFSNYDDGVSVDLRPGAGATMDDEQRALLTASDFANAAEIRAERNVFVARLYRDDERSLIENAIGGDGDDAISGNQAANRLVGGAGDDRLSGLAGGDRLIGGRGDDTLSGGGANDRLAGGKGADRLIGGAGRDKLLGGGDGDNLLGGAGRDRLGGGGGDDALLGGAGSDRLFGSRGDDRLIGGRGDDTLSGGGGADVLKGGGGDDVLFGGAGGDRLSGGGGADRFVFGPAAGGRDAPADVIFGFGRGGDVIDLSGFRVGFGALDIDDGPRGATVSVGDLVIELRGVDAGDLTAGDFLF